MSNQKKSALAGQVFLQRQGQQAFAGAQIDLLLAVDRTGSISAAARELGISYKTAWDRIDALNNLSGKPLVVRSAGGAQGGGTLLTDLGRRITAGFQALQEEHSAFVQRLGQRIQSLNDLADFIGGSAIRTSARNQFRGEITQLRADGVNVLVVLRLHDEQSLVAAITRDSLQQLGLQVGGQALALVKASWVTLHANPLEPDARVNQLAGRVARISREESNSEVIVDLGDGKSICAVTDNASEHPRVGDRVQACFAAASVLLAVG